MGDEDEHKQSNKAYSWLRGDPGDSLHHRWYANIGQPLRTFQHRRAGIPRYSSPDGSRCPEEGKLTHSLRAGGTVAGDRLEGSTLVRLPHRIEFGFPLAGESRFH